VTTRPVPAMSAYALHPEGNRSAIHEVDYGHTVSLTEATNFCWPWGAVRGGTPLQLVNGEYLGFFHTMTNLGSRLVATYVMGAYTVSAEPPFRLTSMSHYPLVPEQLLFGQWTYPRIDFCFFPMAFEYQLEVPTSQTKTSGEGGGSGGGEIHLSLGRNEREGWVITLDYDELKAGMLPLMSHVDATSHWEGGVPIPETLEYL
jgi:hypothetical protein